MPDDRIVAAYTLAWAELRQARGVARDTAQFFKHMDEVSRLRALIKSLRAMHRSTWRPPSGTQRAAGRARKPRKKAHV